jgi:hypothetical protein
VGGSVIVEGGNVLVERPDQDTTEGNVSVYVPESHCEVSYQ